jgi:hypothetical protein
MSVLTQHRILAKTIGASPALSKALVLLKVWLTQRGFRFAADGFDGQSAGLLLAYLLLTRRVSSAAGTSALSAFQTLLTFIAEGHLLECSLDFRVAELGPRKPASQVHASAGIGGPASNGGSAVTEDSAVSLSTSLKHSSVLDASTWDYKRPLVLTHPLGPQSGNKLEDGRYNALWRISASAADMLQSEARKSLHELQHQGSGCFDHLFMQHRSFFERHDQFYHFRVEAKSLPYLENSSIHVPKEDAEASPSLRAVAEMSVAQRKVLRSMLMHCPAPEHFAAAAVQVVGRGLGDRAVCVHSHVRYVADGEEVQEEQGVETSAHVPVWPVPAPSDAQSSKLERNWVVSVGVVLDKEKLDRRVERGPSSATAANIPDIAADPALMNGHNGGSAQGSRVSEEDELHRFKAFWGDKVELRRFKDGAIIESVVWNSPSTGGDGADRVPSVAEQVVRYVMGRHLPAVCGSSGQLLRAVNAQLQQAVLASPSQGASSSEDALSRRAVEALDKLRGVLTSQIKRLPLSYEALMAVAPELRYTSMYPPVQHPILLASCNSDGTAEAAGKGMKRILKQYAGRTVSLLAAPMRVLLQAESSGKWPLEAEAVRKSKLALLLKTRTELKAQFDVRLRCCVKFLCSR